MTGAIRRHLAPLVVMITRTSIDEGYGNDKNEIGAFIDNGNAGDMRLV